MTTEEKRFSERLQWRLQCLKDYPLEAEKIRAAFESQKPKPPSVPLTLPSRRNLRPLRRGIWFNGVFQTISEPSLETSDAPSGAGLGRIQTKIQSPCNLL